MNPSDFRRSPNSVIYSRLWLTTSPPPRRISQVPRSICPRVPSPHTPEGPMAARARCFTIGGGLHHLRKAGHTPKGLTRPKRVHACALRLTGSPIRSFDFTITLQPSVWLLVERAIYKATSFQVARSTRLRLAHRNDGLNLNGFMTITLIRIFFEKRYNNS